jgi:inorganic pyrophosphatase
MSINATHYEDIPTKPDGGPKKRCVHAIIETAMNSPHKYALEAKYGIIALHEVLPDGMHWPYDFGFVPGTLAPDGDPLDILVITRRGLFSGCLAEVRVLGAIQERKNGKENDRLVAVPPPSDGAPQPSDGYRDIDDLPGPQLKEIIDFLKSYSKRQGNRIKIRGIVGAKKAMAIVRKTQKAFAKSRG